MGDAGRGPNVLCEPNDGENREAPLLGLLLDVLSYITRK